MKTQPKEKRAPVVPSKRTALDTGDSAGIDVCIQETSKDFNAVKLFFRPTGSDIEHHLKYSYRRETYEFQNISVEALCVKVLDHLKPYEAFLNTRLDDEIMKCCYAFSDRDKIYEKLADFKENF